VVTVPAVWVAALGFRADQVVAHIVVHMVHLVPEPRDRVIRVLMVVVHQVMPIWVAVEVLVALLQQLHLQAVRERPGPTPVLLYMPQVVMAVTMCLVYPAGLLQLHQGTAMAVMDLNGVALLVIILPARQVIAV
jgi:hypothetical protein